MKSLRFLLIKFNCPQIKAGNQEFLQAKHVLRQSVKAFKLPEVNYFMKHFVPSVKLTLDELE